MKKYIAALAATLAVLMQQPARGSAPGPDDLETWKVREQGMKADLEKALPWKAALEESFAGEPKEIVGFIFLTTYKHRLPDSVPAPEPAAALLAEAKAYSKSWNSVKRSCARAGLKPAELAEAIYRFTNSDWAPVSMAKGPGLDNVTSPREYQAWAKAAIASGAKALKAGMPPAEAWSKQAASYEVREPGDIAKTSPTAPQPRF